MKTFKKIHFRKGWWKSLLAAILCIGVVVGAGFGIASLVKPDKVDKLVTYSTLSNIKYRIGGLDSNGNYMNTDQSIYTKDAFECQGLNCTLDFDNVISYQVYFYDQNNEFVHTTGRLTGAFVQDSVPFFAKYARIVIIPNDDNKVSLTEVAKYAKQLKVEMYREQGFKNYTENLFEIAKTGTTIVYATGAESTEVEGAADQSVTNYVDVSMYKEALVIKSDYTASINNALYLYDENKTWVKSVNIASVATCFKASTGYYYFIDLKKICDAEFKYIRAAFLSNVTVELYCR